MSNNNFAAQLQRDWLDTPVLLKDGSVATTPDGKPLTKQQAIATNILNQAMNRRSSESRAKRLAA